jgi:sterol 24-C-methyltransferase
MAVKKSVQEYFNAYESRTGYQLLLGGTRHFGYYEGWWPFPIGRALRAMEERLHTELGLKEGAVVLDAGAGSGHVACYMAEKGLTIKAIDIVDSHVEQAREYIKAHNSGDLVQISKGNYEHLDFEAASFDGVYTMETLVHGDDPDRAMHEFHRVLKPGGVLVLHEYEHGVEAGRTSAWDALTLIGDLGHLPTLLQFRFGVIRRKLEDAGFIDIEVEDLTMNVAPMFYLFVVLAFLPYVFIRLFGLEAMFVNAVSAMKTYLYFSNDIKYLVVRARKPE